MFRPLVFYIGFRYTRTKKNSGFISFISLSSMIGIALGIMVLITVLSVMNGFDYEIRNRIFNLVRQVTVYNYDENNSGWYELKKEIEKNSLVLASAPFVSGQGMLVSEGFSKGVAVSGILPQEESKISEIQKTMIQGSIFNLKSNDFGIVIGKDIAASFGVGVGSRVTLVTPSSSTTPMGTTPRFKRFTVVGVFNMGEGFNFDSMLVFINLHDAQKLFSLGDNVNGLNLKIKDMYLAQTVSKELTDTLGDNYVVSDWTKDYGSLFKAISMEKTTIFIILLFIIAVAVFNLVSSLVMTVNDKQADIAILRTLGASPKMIMSIFIVQGGLIGICGTLLGMVSGVLLALNAPELVKLLEAIFHTQFISAGIYFVDYLPSRLLWSDVWHICLIAFGMSLLATIYPAWKAAKIPPAIALRYE